jgi:flagellar FliL protein
LNKLIKSNKLDRINLIRKFPMAEEEKTAEGTKEETKAEKKARKAKEKADKKAAKAAAKAAKKGGAAPAEGAEAPAEATPPALDADGNPVPVEAPKGKKKLILIIIIVVVLVGGGAGVFFSGILGGGKDKKADEEDALTKDQILYHDMDELLVNLNNPGTQVSFLKASITLELPNQLSLNEVQEKMPRIRDMFQVYLRELRSSDLQGSAGLQRLRTELLLRVNGIMEKGKVNNILFKEIIVQ